VAEEAEAVPVEDAEALMDENDGTLLLPPRLARSPQERVNLGRLGVCGL
jgi:hypothetical protein